MAKRRATFASCAMADECLLAIPRARKTAVAWGGRRAHSVTEDFVIMTLLPSLKRTDKCARTAEGRYHRQQFERSFNPKHSARSPALAHLCESTRASHGCLTASALAARF